MAEPLTDQFRLKQAMPANLEEARAMARARFRERLERGEQVGNCDCGTEAAPVGSRTDALIGVRFLDSGQLYYFRPGDHELELNDWVVVETSRGQEAARVVIAPHQVALNQLQGDLKPIVRKMSDADVARMDQLKRDAAQAVRTFSAAIRSHKLDMKPISAEYAFDGSQLTLNFSAQDRVDFRNLARDLAQEFGCKVELRQVGARDEARLLGGMGRCGRTLCCASWLPVFPEISMGMAKTQDLPLNPGKVSGVCGRLLCCLSYENEQYRQMKQVMPKLGQEVETPRGPGMVIAMQVLKELVAVRMQADGVVVEFPAAELGVGGRPPAQPSTPPAPRPDRPVAQPPKTATMPVGEPAPEAAEAADGEGAPDEERTGNRRRRRRGRGGRRGGGGGAPAAQPEAQGD